MKAWLEEDVSDATAMDEFIENKKMIDDLLKPVKVRITEDQVCFILKIVAIG